MILSEKSRSTRSMLIRSFWTRTPTPARAMLYAVGMDEGYEISARKPLNIQPSDLDFLSVILSKKFYRVRE
jgi:hypothetical protein